MQSDLSVHIDDGQVTAASDSELVYVLVAKNEGIETVSAARLRTTFPQTLLSNVRWTCSSHALAECPTPAGQGEIDLLVDLPPGAELSYSVWATLIIELDGEVIARAMFVPPHGTAEQFPVDNVAYDRTAAPTRQLFGDGFDSTAR